MKEKTIIEWFDLLPQVLKRLALENIEKNNSVVLRGSLHLALSCAFDWEKTPQGHSFWFFLREHILRNNNKIDSSTCTTKQLNSLRKDGVKVKDYYVKEIIETL